MADKTKPKNPWMVHLNQFRKENPNLTLTEAMKRAKKTYNSKK